MRTQAGVWADLVVFADFATFKMGEWGDFGVGTDFGVFDHAVGTDFDVVAEFDFAFDDDVDVKSRHLVRVSDGLVNQNVPDRAG